MSNSNLPVDQNIDSSQGVRLFFNNYFNAPITFPAGEIDAVVGFFKKRGFDDVASNSTAIVLLQQAKIDTLKGLTDIQLSSVVAEVLNYNRQKNSTLGYRQTDTSELLEKRNVLI